LRSKTASLGKRVTKRAHDAVTLGAWTTTSHVERAPQKAKVLATKT
jgi:hypothetical protein